MGPSMGKGGGDGEVSPLSPHLSWPQLCVFTKLEALRTLSFWVFIAVSLPERNPLNH